VQLDIASIVVGLLVGGVVSALTAWATFGRFVAKDAERERAWWEWRNGVDKRLDAHAGEIRDHGDRIARMEHH
jgi:hypothetical protein